MKPPYPPFSCPPGDDPHSALKKNLERIQADDEFEDPYLAGFEWDKDECYTRFVVHQKKEGGAPPKKGKKKGGEE